MTRRDDVTFDIRGARSNALASQIFHAIRAHLPTREVERAVIKALVDELHGGGYEVITDRMRAEAGLPPRGEKGWTAEELVAMERRRLEILLQPPRMMKP